MSRQAAIPVVEDSQVGEVRRMAARLAETAELSETDRGKVAIVATELANNLVRHARDGQILLQIVPFQQGRAVELISIDRGPGIASVDRSLQDGYSTAGTCGNGLGAIKRLSTEFDIFSSTPTGTLILSRIATQSVAPGEGQAFELGAVSVAMPGETACGDGWTCAQSKSEFRLMVADGLGHGILAEEAADAATAAFDAQNLVEPATILKAAHGALAGTRGAAVAIALIDLQSAKLKYAGIGNIAGAAVTPTKRQGLVSHNGIVGAQSPRIHQFDYDLDPQGLVIMASDGLKSRWSLDDHPGLSLRHPAIIAALLYRDYARGRDDATVVVVRFNGKA